MGLRRILVHESHHPVLNSDSATAGIVTSGTVLWPNPRRLRAKANMPAFVEIAGHAENDAVGMNGLLMKRDQVFAVMDSIERTDVSARAGMGGP